VTRQVFYINGVPIEAGPRCQPPAPRRLPPPQRPGCMPPCCGALYAGNGGHRNDNSHECDYRTGRVFDHLTGESEDKRFSAVARAMCSEAWWRGIPIIVVPADVAGEIEVRQ
jgi:hypothetical protein